MNNWPFPFYEEKPLIPTKDAQNEMDDIGLDLWQIKEIIEKGYECSRSQRAKNIVERCIFKRGKEVRVVVALVEWKQGSFWRIIHVGKTSGH